MSESLSQKYERILSMLEVGKRHGAFTQISCPIKAAHKHEDAGMSASLGLHSNGISFKCFTGCQTDDFLQALNLTYKDLFPDNGNIPTNIYTYHNADGSYHHDKIKYPRDPVTGKKNFRQRTIDDVGNVKWSAESGVPFGYPKLIDAIKNGKIVVYTEGEKDAETAWVLGYEATTMGGASDWKDEYKKYFKDANLIIISDKDDAGLKFVSKMIESLKPVAKSLKTLILPFGKDLTEWVEAGNCDLKTLIEKNATELISTQGIPEPIVKTIVGGYEFYWIGYDIKIIIDHIENDGTVEIAVYENSKALYISKYNLLTVNQKLSLAKALFVINNKIKWDIIVNQITIQSLLRIREGEQVIFLGNSEDIKKPEFLVAPLFVKNNANIIYADRSSAKSIYMSFISILLTLGMWDNPYGLSISGLGHRVLFLDWENDSVTTGWQSQCLLKGLEQYALELPYLHCSRPLVQSLPQIQQKINEVKADVIIIDSLAVAVGKNINDSEPALEFYGALRQLPVTPLIIAHTAKDKTNNHKTVYGNAFYENLARSIWEASKTQEKGTNELILSLYQRKTPPFSGLHLPLGFKFIFDGDCTYVKSCEAQPDPREKDTQESK